MDATSKTVDMADLVSMHGHLCDGLVRGAYAFAALVEEVFGDAPIDRTDLAVVSKNSPCLGDVAAYLTGARVRFGSHRFDAALGVGYRLQRISTGEMWEVREDPGFFPALISAWEAAILSDELDVQDKAELAAVNEAMQWNWVRFELLPTEPSGHYQVRSVQHLGQSPAISDGRRTDVVNRDLPGPKAFRSPYADTLAVPAEAARLDPADPWVARYLEGPS